MNKHDRISDLGQLDAVRQGSLVMQTVHKSLRQLHVANCCTLRQRTLKVGKVKHDTRVIGPYQERW